MADERHEEGAGHVEIADSTETFLSSEDLAAGGEDPQPAQSPGDVISAVSGGEPAATSVRHDPSPPGSSARYSKAQTQRARELLTRLYAIRRAARFYPLEHPAVTEAIDMLAHAAHSFHDEGVDVHLSFFEGEILLGEQLLTEESLAFDQLVRDMTAIGVGSLVIRRGFEIAELARSMQIIAADGRDIDAAGGLDAALAALRLRHVIIGTVRAVERTDVEAGTSEENARASYGGAVSLLREIDRLMRVNRHVPAGKVKGVVRSLVDNVVSNRYAMLQLTGLKNYDEYTFYHSANVAILSLALGSMITQDYRFLSSLGAGALLHDIGKLAVDVDILNKPGALSPEEWASVREHPVRGAQMVSVLPGVDKASLVVILEHHMRFDGSGYPQRHPARPQHLSSRIVAVADSYDAMTSRRSYSAARVQDEAMSLLAKGGGNALDPTLVRLFIRLMGVYPPRSVVRLSAGQVAIVLSPSAHDPVRPLVRVIAAENGDIIDPVDIDLTASPEMSIRGCIDPRLLNIEVDAYL